MDREALEVERAGLRQAVSAMEGVLGVVTSANVACGFHAGTRATMQAVCAGVATLTSPS